MRRRASAAIGLAMLLAGGLLAAGATAISSFGEKVRVDGDNQYSWLDGEASIATTTTGGGTTYLHTLYASDYSPAGVFSDDQGPYLGTYYRRTALDGSGDPRAWSKPKKLNGDYHAERISLASSGTYVYAVWAKQLHYYDGAKYTFKTGEPRRVYFRANTSHGAAAAWRSPVTLSPKSGRADYLWISAAGTYVYVTWTEAGSGAIRVAVSPDRGQTWTKRTVDTTTLVDNVTGYVGGYSGLPAIAATNGGVDAGVVWLDNPSGKVVYSTTDDSGATWSAPADLEATGGAANNGFPEAAARGDRIAFTWTTPDAAKLAIYDAAGAALGPLRTIADCTTAEYEGCEGAAVALDGTSTVGVALAMCFGNSDPCDWLDNRDREDLLWFESTDDGANWSPAVAVQAAGTQKCTWINDFAAAVYTGGRAYVYWNGWNATYVCYHAYLRVGS